MSKHTTKAPPRMRDEDPRRAWEQEQAEAWKHSCDPKVACILYNTNPGLGESSTLGPIVNRSLWTLKQMLRKQGYLVGAPHLLMNQPFGPITHHECYVLPYCPAPLRGDLVGLEHEDRKVYLSTLTSIGHDVAQALWVSADRQERERIRLVSAPVSAVSAHTKR